MSDPVTYAVNYNKLNNRLLVYYDFVTGEYVGAGLIYNSIPARNTGLYTGVATAATNSSQLLSTFLEPNGSGNFGYSNLEITGGLNCDFDNLSVIIDFEQYGTDSSILFGSYEPFVSNGVTGASGYNWGINSYGRMFFQHMTDQHHYIYNSNIDLSQKNIVSFSINGASIDINRHDYNRNTTETNTFLVDQDSIINPQKVYFGGANNFYRSNNALQPTLSGWVGNIMVFSGYLSPEQLHSVGSGFISDYSYTAATSKTVTKITGLTTVPSYPIEHTGYSVIYTTESKNISGQVKNFGGSFVVDSLDEGETYLTGILMHGDLFKQKRGMLINPSPFNYSPTGDEAIDTLGLREDSASRQVFTSSVTYTTPEETGLIKYVVSGATGMSDEPTGYIQVALYNTTNVTTPASSGINLNNGFVDLYNYNYIYYKEARI